MSTLKWVVVWLAMAGVLILLGNYDLLSYVSEEHPWFLALYWAYAAAMIYVLFAKVGFPLLKKWKWKMGFPWPWK